MKRRFPALLLLVLAVVAAGVFARSDREPATARFSIAASGWMPAALPQNGLTETWFCPGVPATGVDGVSGEVLIANRGVDRLVGTITLLNENGDTRRLDVDVDPWATARIDLTASLGGAMVAATVEIDGGGALVEQRSIQPDGNSVATCANATSDTWFLADGYTVDGSLDQVVLTNPFDQTVVANLEFATREGSRAPASYRGLTVAARSVKVIDLGAPGAGAQGEPILAVKVAATRGRLVVGRSQRFLGGGRGSAQVTVATPSLASQWWFAGSQKGLTVTERYSIYNPTDDRVEVDVVFVGIQNSIGIDPIVVPARQVVTFEPGTIAELPEGRHAVVFFTLADDSIAVERATTTTVDGSPSTSVLMGAFPRIDGYLATTWYVGAGPPAPTSDALVIYNADNSAGTVSVSAIGSAGPVPVAGLTDLPLGAASLLTIDLTDPLTVGRQLVIESSSRIFVERSYPTGQGDARVSSWAVPAG